jgi:hypothetical protein
MPASYLIDQTRGVVFSRGWGVLTDEEILAHGRGRPGGDARLTPASGRSSTFGT